MSRFRFTIRRMMVAVAIVGVVLVLDKMAFDFLMSARHGEGSESPWTWVGMASSILGANALVILFVCLWRLARYD